MSPPLEWDETELARCRAAGGSAIRRRCLMAGWLGAITGAFAFVPGEGIRLEVTNSHGCPRSSRAVMPAVLAPVSERAPSTTPCSTALGSRSSVMRRLAWLRRERLSRRAAFSVSISSKFILVAFLSDPQATAVWKGEMRVPRGGRWSLRRV